MIRTIKLEYEATPQAVALIQLWRRNESVLIRTAYNRLHDGIPVRDLYAILKGLRQGQTDTWLNLSAIKKAQAIQKANGPRKVVFGGKQNLAARRAGKLTHEEWRAQRLLPLYIEGHAKSHGSQGGNHRFDLDLAQKRIWFIPQQGIEFELKLKLGNTNYHQRLEALQQRCQNERDTPYTVSLTDRHITVSWEEKTQGKKARTRKNRVLSLDLNPNRIGWSVLERNGRLVHWGILEYPELNQRLHLASDAPETIAQNHKRAHEYSLLAKEVVSLAAHYQCHAVVTESLGIETKDHEKGKSFNRAVNNYWARKSLLLPLVRRLEDAGIKHQEVNPAYSSKIGNLLYGWGLNIPDPACAAVEIARRYFCGDPKTGTRTKEPTQRKEEAPAKRHPSREAREAWKQVWEHLKPKAGDTSRYTLMAQKHHSPTTCPRPCSFKSPHSQVVRLQPARLTSAPRIIMRRNL
jgi:IS605 OrfB family transposase